MDTPHVLNAVTLTLTWVLLGACLVHYNNWVMKPGRFPHAFALSCLHMTATVVLSGFLYLARPSSFPAMDTVRGMRLSLFWWFVPVGCLFAAAVFLGNKAYLYADPSFLQFMKEGNLVILYTLMCCVGRQEFTRAKVGLVIWISSGSAIATFGELRLSWLGFFVQLSAMLADAGRVVLGDWIMNASRIRPDAMTYTLFISPVCLVVLAFGTIAHWSSDIARDFARMWPMLVPNAVLAFALNIATAAFIKECSGIATVLAGRFKDIVVVIMSMAMFSSPVMPKQFVGFTIALTGVFFWSYGTTSPDSHLVELWARLWCSEDRKRETRSTPQPDASPFRLKDVSWDDYGATQQQELRKDAP